MAVMKNVYGIKEDLCDYARNLSNDKGFVGSLDYGWDNDNFSLRFIYENNGDANVLDIPINDNTNLSDARLLLFNFIRDNSRPNMFSKNKETNSQVDHPAYYQGNSMECIDIMEQMFGTYAVSDFCKCNAFKYRFRAGNKPGEEAEKDIAKAEWCENKLSELNNKLKKGGIIN